MKLTKKLLLSLLVAVFLITLVGGASIAFADVVPTADEAEPAPISGYYGSRLRNPVEVEFYRAMQKMDFTTGCDTVEITGEGVEALAMKYAHGDKELLQRYGAASDCFYFDYPELFYVDFDRITVSVTLSNGNYIVRLGTGKTENYYKKGVTSENIGEMLETYNAQMKSLVAQIQAKIDWATQSWQSAPDKKDIATFICQAICDRITYGFCTTEDGKDTVNSPFIRTTYGALVVRECVCEGYARLYKALCDRFDIECVLIFGDYVYANGTVEPHGWNAVKVQNSAQGDDREYWYAVDPTFEDTGRNGEYSKQYLMVTKTYIEADHFPNPVISSSGYELPYPELKDITLEMPSGLMEAKYQVDANGNIYLAISYGGYNSQQLMQGAMNGQKLYMAFRTKYGDQWGHWSSVFIFDHTYANAWIHEGAYSRMYVGNNTAVQQHQIAIFDILDDAGIKDKDGYYAYYSDSAVANHLVEASNSIQNETYDPYYVSPPFVKSVKYSYNDNGKVVSGTNFQTSMQTLGFEYTIEVQYTQPLRLVDSSKPVTISYEVSQLEGTRTTDLSAVYENCLLRDVTMLNDTTVRFKFTPSPLYQHNKIWYTFSLENLENIPTGDKQAPVKPNTFATLWGYTDTIVCTKCLGGGRYLLDNVYAQPALVDDSDLSMSGWTYNDENGKSHKVSESQRSNLALVVNTPTGPVAAGIEENLDAAVKENQGNAAQVMASQTYEIDLQICGMIVSIPNGSYLKIKLGYPKGFNYDSTMEGVTFKLYHFRRDSNGQLDYEHPEEIECVFTELGIIALVESFSPYTIVALTGVEEQQSSRSVVTQFNGIGGEISNDFGKPVVSLNAGEQVMYTLNPYIGYEIDYVLLNGAPIAATDGKVNIRYADLPDSNIANTLSVGYVATAVKQAEAEQGEINVSLAYIANTVAEDSVAIGENATVSEVQTAVAAANTSAAAKITGEAQTVSEAPLASAQLPAMYTISFVDGGVEIPAIIACEGDILVEPTVALEGYEFGGWQHNGMDIEFPQVMPAEDMVLVAIWIGDDVTVTFDTNGGSALAPVTAKAGSVVEITPPTKADVVFIGWLLDGEIFHLTRMPAHDVTLVAVWGYTVIFDVDGGSSVDSALVAHGSLATVPATPTKTGHSFAGWTLNGATYNFDTAVTQNITLKASWTTLKFTISFDSNGGSAVESITADFGSVVTAPANPTKKDCRFGGWTLAGNAYTFGTMPAEDITLVAQWIENEPTGGKNNTLAIVLVVVAVVAVAAALVSVLLIKKRKK